MRYFSFAVKYRLHIPTCWGMLTLIALLFNSVHYTAKAQTPGETNTITAVSSQQQDENTLDIILEGTSAPTYTVYELFKPARIVVDLAETALAQDAAISIPDNSGITLATDDVTDSTPPIKRFTFTLTESRPFTVIQQANNVVISLKQPEGSSEKVADQVKAEQGGVIAVNDIQVQTTPGETRVIFLSNGKITDYKYDVLDKSGDTPPRLYIDINNVTGDTLLKEQKVGTALAAIRVAKRGNGLRFVLDSSKNTLFPFQVTPMDNGLEVRIEEGAKQDELSALIQQKQTIESQLPQVDPLQQKKGPSGAQSITSSMQDTFSFSGYNKERITVDFYKIDLHNVFRLLREVSKTNIVVDEAVAGSLTLALNDVPWDFALDIVLNLKDLQKEERFNTIVILPRDKAFSWPERAEDNLSFEADEAITEQEAILIQQQMNIPKTVVAAKQFIGKGKEYEKKDEFENAIQQYELALQQWPQNSKLANKISSIYLVQLKQNAKALYFAKKALAIEKDFANASLNAAIASANMQDTKSAQQYFDQAVTAKTPIKEALLSYAVYSEEQQQYSEALKLLKKHDMLYGENLNSMVTRARILDKQGNHDEATAEYKKILLSGYRVEPDLKKFIQGRVALSQPM